MTWRKKGHNGNQMYAYYPAAPRRKENGFDIFVHVNGERIAKGTYHAPGLDTPVLSSGHERRRLPQRMHKLMNSEIPYLAALAILAIGAYYVWASRKEITERIRTASLRSIRIMRHLSLVVGQKSD